ncbi:hypothetical protein [Nocardioides alkalitolerans]|uniref:hypothetical protein n=1 Tax=Nocardioides alkalitolerans TaxID=281714 RepID=UPI00048E86C7|nr:hypothetical protein [Nocardioides alkalitolerans]
MPYKVESLRDIYSERAKGSSAAEALQDALREAELEGWQFVGFAPVVPGKNPEFSHPAMLVFHKPEKKKPGQVHGV